MNKHLFVGIIAALILFSGGYLLVVGRNKADKELTNSALSRLSPVPTKTLNSLKELFSSGSSQECTFATEVSGYPSKGNVYVNNKKMRGDFESEIEGRPVKSHMIVINNTSYMWSNGQSQGIKLVFDESDLEDAQRLADQAKLDINAELDYECKPWNPDAALFELPGSIEFASLDEMIKNIPTGTVDQCAECESLTGDSKTQCKSALKCS